MAEEKTSILLSDVSIEGEVIEKDKIIIDAKINGDIKAEDIVTHSKFLMYKYDAEQKTQIQQLKSKNSIIKLKFLKIY